MNKYRIIRYLSVHIITYVFFHVGIEQLPIAMRYEMIFLYVLWYGMRTYFSYVCIIQI